MFWLWSVISPPLLLQTEALCSAVSPLCARFQTGPLLMLSKLPQPFSSPLSLSVALMPSGDTCSPELPLSWGTREDANDPMESSSGGKQGREGGRREEQLRGRDEFRRGSERENLNATGFTTLSLHGAAQTASTEEPVLNSTAAEDQTDLRTASQGHEPELRLIKARPPQLQQKLGVGSIMATNRERPVRHMTGFFPFAFSSMRNHSPFDLLANGSLFGRFGADLRKEMAALCE
ncbi:hypothetical protein DNTS_008274 [Danionella cerebrum]|uniref:Uncharacterized protein n=1 Tax=Danionella cerebrum TaxID=2873325 RepID=A0A553R6H5_9TELE|nr:hypothetical protein DNTS_008274 [Danionella translucida]